VPGNQEACGIVPQEAAATAPRWHAFPPVGGQTKVDPKEDKDEAMEFQNAKRVLKDIYDHSDSDSSTNKRHKALHIMYGGSWDIMF
jgi:hypothetical protein